MTSDEIMEEEHKKAKIGSYQVTKSEEEKIREKGAALVLEKDDCTAK